MSSVIRFEDQCAEKLSLIARDDLFVIDVHIAEHEDVVRDEVPVGCTAGWRYLSRSQARYLRDWLTEVLDGEASDE